MKAPTGKTSAVLCASTVLTALLMCLLNGEHYAEQLESAWPVSRPLAVAMSELSERSALPKLRAFLKQNVDAGCAAIWHAGGGAGGAELAPLPEPELPPAPAVSGMASHQPGREAPAAAPATRPEPAPGAVAQLPPSPATEEPKEVETPAHPSSSSPEFCGFHHQWLGRDRAETRDYEFGSFHEQWLGKAEAEKLVDSCPVSCRVMLMGDSLMEDFGVYFYQHLKSRRGMQMILTAKFSTGLCRPDYFNWFELFPRTMDEKQPHIVLFMIGANDGQPVWYSRGHVVQTKPAEQWKAAYGERVGLLLADAQKRQVLPLWVGMPVMGSKYAALLAQTEESTRETCAHRNVPYIDNRALLADGEGQYQSFIKNEEGKMVRVRQKDKEHMTPEGNRMLVRAAMAAFEQVLRQHRLNHPELCAYPEQRETLAKPTLEISIPYKPSKK